MAKAEVTRKQLLKEPDQFITFSGKLIALIQSYAKPILIGIGSILTLILIIAVAGQLSNRTENKASAEVEKALAKYAAALQDTDAQTAYDRVKTDFNAIFDAYGSKNAVKIARIVYGDISYQAGDADTAIAMYQQALEDFSEVPALKHLVFSGLGHAYLLKEALPESIGYFERLSTEAEGSMQSAALFNLAWLYDLTGETEKSKARYEKLLAEFPDSIYGDLVREKINS